MSCLGCRFLCCCQQSSIHGRRVRCGGRRVVTEIDLHLMIGRLLHSYSVTCGDYGLSQRQALESKFFSSSDVFCGIFEDLVNVALQSQPGLQCSALTAVWRVFVRSRLPKESRSL
jgi:hypothetical protein